MRAPTMNLTNMMAAALALSLFACVDSPTRDNPLDPANSADPELEVSLVGTRLELTWQAVAGLDVVRYRVFRRDFMADDSPASLLVERSPSGDGEPLSDRDPTALQDAPDIGFELTAMTPFGETAVLAEARFTRTDDIDGDGVITGDCDAADPHIHPGAEERCNGVDDNCNGLTDETRACAGYCDPVQCKAGEFCVGDACSGISCQGDRDCPDGALCARGGRCQKPGPKADGAPCATDLDCEGGWCGEAGLCGGWHERCPPTACPGDLTCAEVFDVCTKACGAGACPDGQRCVGGWCLPGCGGEADCNTDGACVSSYQEPVDGGGCALAPPCDSCSADQHCVVGPEGTFSCCDDRDGDGYFATDCAWGSDCDDGNGAVWDQCGPCTTSADCAGAQCVMGGNGVGTCGGPPGCHCPAGSACLTGDGAPQCVLATSCFEDNDCQLAATGAWFCRDVAVLGAKRCVCEDPAVCPACLFDEECLASERCESGACVAR